MINFHYDKLNSFGERVGAGIFPDIIGLGDASADRYTVELKLKSNTNFTSLTLVIEGSNSETGPWNVVTTGPQAMSYANFVKDGYSVAISPNKYKYLRANLSTAANGAGSTFEAIINTYLGK
jgi:hypothetical protein